MPTDEDRAKAGEEFVGRYALGERCHAGRDGDCADARCPQERDGEPAATGRHCPLDPPPDDDYWGC
jgi:hypothetical protein